MRSAEEESEIQVMNAGGNSTTLPPGQRARPQTGGKHTNTPPLMRQTRQVTNSELGSQRLSSRVCYF